MPHWGRIPKLSLVMIVTPRNLELAVFTEACGRRDDRVSPGQNRDRRAHGEVGKYSGEMRAPLPVPQKHLSSVLGIAGACPCHWSRPFLCPFFPSFTVSQSLEVHCLKAGTCLLCWCLVPVIPARRQLKLEDHCRFETSLDYTGRL